MNILTMDNRYKYYILIFLTLFAILLATSLPKYQEIERFTTNDSPQVYVEYFYKKDCLGCRKFESEWKKLSNKYSKSKEVALKYIDAKDENFKKLIKKRNIKSVPAIFIYSTENSESEPELYSGKMTATAIEKYFRKKLSNESDDESDDDGGDDGDDESNDDGGDNNDPSKCIKDSLEKSFGKYNSTVDSQTSLFQKTLTKDLNNCLVSKKK